jgi:subtilisin family serine protease
VRDTPLVRALATPPAAWRSLPLAPVDVAVIDSGVDASHPDLVGRVAESYAMEPSPEGPKLLAVGPGANNDLFGHGTGVAGIVAKVAPNARIVDLRILDAENAGTAPAFLAAIGEAVKRRWPVVNLSLALSRKFAADARGPCEVAWRQGQVIVAAKRNVPVMDFGLPAEFATSISVDMEEAMPDLIAYAFRPEQMIEFAALGQHPAAPAAGGGYTEMIGSSFATPVLSGLCALLLGAFPGLLPFEVRAVLRHHAIDAAA